MKAVIIITVVILAVIAMVTIQNYLDYRALKQEAETLEAEIQDDAVRSRSDLTFLDL